jgi:hypothetical protein
MDYVSERIQEGVWWRAQDRYRYAEPPINAIGQCVFAGGAKRLHALIETAAGAALHDSPRCLQKKVTNRVRAWRKTPVSDRLPSARKGR